MTGKLAILNTCLFLAVGAAVGPQFFPGTELLARYIVVACALIAVATTLSYVGRKDNPQEVRQQANETDSGTTAKDVTERSIAEDPAEQIPVATFEHLAPIEHERLASLDEHVKQVRHSYYLRAYQHVHDRTVQSYLRSYQHVYEDTLRQQVLSQHLVSRLSRTQQLTALKEVMNLVQASDQATFGSLTITLRENETVIQISPAKKDRPKSPRDVEAAFEVARTPAPRRSVH